MRQYRIEAITATLNTFVAENFCVDDLIAILVHFIEKHIPHSAKPPWLLHIIMLSTLLATFQ